MNKKIIGIVIVVVILVVVGISRQSGSTEASNVKIGNILYMTGPLAALGEQEINGMNLALEHVNKNGGVKGKMLEIVTEDYAGDPKKAVSAYELLRTKNLDIIMFDGGSAIGPIGPLVRKDNTLGMVPVGVTHSYFDGNSRTCRIALTTRDYGKTIGNYLENKFKTPRVGFIVTANEYGKAVQTEITRQSKVKEEKLLQVKVTNMQLLTSRHKPQNLNPFKMKWMCLW